MQALFKSCTFKGVVRQLPSKKPVFTLRTEKENLMKLSYIAEQENRSDNKELEYILLSYIKEYENEHGEIKATEN